MDGSLAKAKFKTDPYFGFAVPSEVPGVEPHILTPHKTWADKADFAATAKKLNELFAQNFKRFEAHVDREVKLAAPSLQIAA
jgi:phosphoenolpyruvate carboxykinase (ATP)